jgi:two-component system, OmpR family, response regulator
MRALVVEDDVLLAEGLAHVLSRAGHSVENVATGMHADLLLTNEEFGLVVLDVGLPDIDGFEVLRRLRQRRSSPNVLVLTARDAVEDRVRGLDLGADDYMTKPFLVTEFEARIRALLRRNVVPAVLWDVGDMTVDFAAKRLRVGDQPIELTPREWVLLQLFLTNPGRVLSKDQIAENLFASDEQLSPNAIEIHVSRLRAKIGPAGTYVRTVRGFGYFWKAENK